MEYRWHSSMATIARDRWNDLAEVVGPTPLLHHEWLNHLETSGSITPRNGWVPQHLTVHDGERLVAAVPLYRRDHSLGEFVFDFAFAQVAEEIGATYYPKLVGMSPATPSTAYGFLVEPGREHALLPGIMEEIERYCHREGIGVLQFNFILPRWRKLLEPYRLVAWEHHGYQWYNEDFESFEDYLARFHKGQRRNIRRERASLAKQGLRAVIVPGTEAPDELFHRMARYYLRTNARFGPWAARFLTSRFFSGMPREVRGHVWFAAAIPDASASAQTISEPVALAMLLRRGDHLLGRYWGTENYARDLHFNLCYYTPMEWAIAQGIRTFDPGMGSEHKVRRGFRSVPTCSLHRFFDPTMDSILRANIDRINAMEQEQIESLDAAIPFRRGR